MKTAGHNNHNGTAEEINMTTNQTRILDRIYDDGARCRRKGLGITKSGLYDNEQVGRIIARHQRANYAQMSDDIDQAWRDGWNDEDDRIGAEHNGARGFAPC